MVTSANPGGLSLTEFTIGYGLCNRSDELCAHMNLRFTPTSRCPHDKHYRAARVSRFLWIRFQPIETPISGLIIENLP